jgi:hypothetical protein
MLRAPEYAAMIGPVEKRVWNQDIQPKDPRHMRMSTKKNAIYQASKFLGSAGAIGSQFSINEDDMTLQMINGELWYVVPLDYNGLMVWWSTDGAPGYIKVNAEDPHRQSELVMLDGAKMKYMPGAFFGNNLERHLILNGYYDRVVSDWTFEIDENGKPFWVVTVSKPTIFNWAKKVLGVAIVEPITGRIDFKKLGEIPEWVDRVVPGSYVNDYLGWQGNLSGGWWNTLIGHLNLTKPEEPILVYGTGDQPEWVTGITSKSEKDDSLVALVYTNSRTGKSVTYEMKGGATNTAIIDAVEKNQQVQLKHLLGVSPQIYNIYGKPTSVVPCLNVSHAFQGVAMVPIDDIQTVAYGEDQHLALLDLEKQLAKSGQRVAIDKNRNLQVVQGVVDRINSEVASGGSIYFVHIADVAHLFTAGSGESSKLPVTKEGDIVKIEYYASGKDVVPIRAFDNLSLPLSKSEDQKNIQQRVENSRRRQEKKEDAATDKERLNKLSPEDMKKALLFLQSQKAAQ